MKYEVVLESQLATEMKRWWWKIVFVVALYFWHFSTILHFYYRHLGTLCHLKSKLNTNDLWVTCFFHSFYKLQSKILGQLFEQQFFIETIKFFSENYESKNLENIIKFVAWDCFLKNNVLWNGMEWQIILFLKICKHIHTNLTFTLAHSFIPWLILKSISITLKSLP